MKWRTTHFTRHPQRRGRQEPLADLLMRGGFAGGALLLLTKFAALLSLENRTAGIMLAPLLGRWGMAAAA